MIKIISVKKLCRQSLVFIIMLFAFCFQRAIATVTPSGTTTPKTFHVKTACIDAPTQQHCQGEGTTIYPWIDDYPEPIKSSKWENVPVSIATLLMTLPESELPLPQGLLAEYLHQSAHVLPITGFGKTPDYLIYQLENQTDNRGVRFWLRTFEGKHEADTVYLIGIGSYCKAIDDYFSRHPQQQKRTFTGCYLYPVVDDEDEENELDSESWDDEWNHERQYRSNNSRIHQLHAYRKDTQGKLQNVTKEVLPSLSVLAIPEKTLTAYWQRGFRGIFVNDVPLAEAPLFQWIAQLYPNEPKIDNDPQIFDGYFVNFGFVVWNGKTFEYHQQISDSLCAEQPLLATYCEKIKKVSK